MDIIKKDCKGLSIGQSLLLQEAVDSLQTASKDKSTVPAGLEATPSVSTAGGRSQFLQEKLSNGESLTVTDVMNIWSKDILESGCFKGYTAGSR